MYSIEVAFQECRILNASYLQTEKDIVVYDRSTKLNKKKQCCIMSDKSVVALSDENIFIENESVLIGMGHEMWGTVPA